MSKGSKPNKIKKKSSAQIQTKNFDEEDDDLKFERIPSIQGIQNRKKKKTRSRSLRKKKIKKAQ